MPAPITITPLGQIIATYAGGSRHMGGQNDQYTFANFFGPWKVGSALYAVLYEGTEGSGSPVDHPTKSQAYKYTAEDGWLAYGDPSPVVYLYGDLSDVTYFLSSAGVIWMIAMVYQGSNISPDPHPIDHWVAQPFSVAGGTWGSAFTDTVDDLVAALQNNTTGVFERESGDLLFIFDCDPPSTPPIGRINPGFRILNPSTGFAAFTSDNILATDLDIHPHYVPEGSIRNGDEVTVIFQTFDFSEPVGPLNGSVYKQTINADDSLTASEFLTDYDHLMGTSAVTGVSGAGAWDGTKFLIPLISSDDVSGHHPPCVIYWNGSAWVSSGGLDTDFTTSSGLGCFGGVDLIRKDANLVMVYFAGDYPGTGTIRVGYVALDSFDTPSAWTFATAYDFAAPDPAIAGITAPYSLYGTLGPISLVRSGNTVYLFTILNSDTDPLAVSLFQIDFVSGKKYRNTFE